jgi:hypothetical protein
MFHRVQYGKSDILPKYLFPPTGLTIEKTFVLRQKAFGLPEPLAEYHDGIQDTEGLEKTNLKCKNGENRERNDESVRRRKKRSPDK